MLSLVAFSPMTPNPLLESIVLIVAAWAFLRAWDFMAARRWRWTIAEWFLMTFYLGLLLAFLAL
jgi:hypothetical protein